MVEIDGIVYGFAYDKRQLLYWLKLLIQAINSPQIFKLNNLQLQMSHRASPIRNLDSFHHSLPSQSLVLIAENERLTRLLVTKNEEVSSLILANEALKESYSQQAAIYQKMIDSLERQLTESQRSKSQQFSFIKEKYTQISAGEVDNLKNTHSHQIQFLFKEIAQLRAALETEKAKTAVKDHELESLKESYERQLEDSQHQVSKLNRIIQQLEDSKVKELREVNQRRQLEKSRTTGLVSSRKESSQYMEKQLRKLSQDVLEKTILIQNINRELTKEKKKTQDMIKLNQKKIDALTQEYQEKLKQKELQLQKVQKMLKQEIFQYKQKELKLLNEVESQKSSLNNLKRQIDSKNEIIKQKAEENASVKQVIQKMREQHITQINNLMKERRKKSSHMGSSRSLSSSLKESGIVESNPDSQQMSLVKMQNSLPPVKEQSPGKGGDFNSPDRKDFSQDLNNSAVHPSQQEESDLARAIYHYDTIIEELKRSHSLEMELCRHEIERATRKLQQKQAELEDVLTKFSPLVKIHADQKSLEEDRRERIQRHWKGDLALLQILLKKYKIQVYEN